MRNLHYYNESPFNSDAISLPELLSFSTDHLQRLISNNPGGIFTTRIAPTQTALTGVLAGVTDDQTSLNLRKAMKGIKDDFRSALPEQLGRIYAAVQAQYGVKAPELTIIFGSGRSAFSQCADDCLGPLLLTMSNQLTARTAALGAPLVASGLALSTSWQSVYGESESSGGAKITSREGKLAARQALQTELFKNLLTIALNYPDQPAKVDLYMVQSLLEDHPAAAVPGQAAVVVGDVGPGTYSVGLEAEGTDVVFDVFEKLTSAADFAQVGTDVAPGNFTRTGLTAGQYEIKATPKNAAGSGPQSDVATLTVS